MAAYLGRRYADGEGMRLGQQSVDGMIFCEELRTATGRARRLCGC
jgi:hypothetical protein